MNTNIKKISTRLVEDFPTESLDLVYGKFIDINQEQKDFFYKFSAAEKFQIIYGVYSLSKYKNFDWAEKVLSSLFLVSIFSYEKDNFVMEMCEGCDGDGKIDCPYCDDDECSVCNNSGRILCNVCKGNGDIESNSLLNFYIHNYLISDRELLRFLKDRGELLKPVGKDLDFLEKSDEILSLGNKFESARFKSFVQPDSDYCFFVGPYTDTSHLQWYGKMPYTEAFPHKYVI